MRGRVLTVAVIAMLSLATGASGASAASPVAQSGRMAVTAGATNHFNEEFRNPATGLMLDIVGPSTQIGARLDQANQYNTKSQLWNLWVFGDGSYEFVNEYSGLCMDVDGPSMSNGAAVHQWSCYGGASQRWKPAEWLVRVSPTEIDLVWVIINASSGKCLDVVDRSTDPGALLQQWDCTGTPNQQFVPVPVWP